MSRRNRREPQPAPIGQCGPCDRCGHTTYRMAHHTDSTVSWRHAGCEDAETTEEAS